MIHFNGPTTVHTVVEGDMHDLTVHVPAPAGAALLARIAELEAQLFEYEVEYGVAPPDVPDYSPATARATVLAAARRVVAFYAEGAGSRTLDELEAALHAFSQVDRAAWRATLLAHKARKEAPDGR